MVDIDRTKSLGRLRELAGADTKLAKDGDRYKGLCPFHTEKTPSFGIFTGADGHERYHCFGCGATGDVLDYVMETRHVDFREAATIIAGSDAVPSGSKPRGKPKPPHDPYAGVTPVVPIPKGTPKIKVGERIQVWNPKRERYTNYTPTLTHVYRDVDGEALGYVLRMDMSDGRKITPMVQWCKRKGKPEGEWSHYTFKRPRTLYAIDRIKKKKQVVVVEGEKTADVGYTLLGPATAVVSWSGGTNAVEFTDWSSLKDRDVIVVPDADKVGRASADRIAEVLDGIGAKRLRVVDTSEMEKVKEGWDLADVDGWDRKETLKWLSDRAEGWAPPAPDDEAVPDNKTQVPATTDDWKNDLIWNAEGTPKATSQSNYIAFLRHHPDLKGVFSFNEFSLQITLIRCPPWDKEETFKVRSLTDEDVIFCQAALEQYGLAPKYDGARKAIIAAASKLSFHPARDFFTALRDKWDGKKRLDKWLSYYLGADHTPFASMVGRKWLVAAVRRVFEPGCKFDTMLILEGPQNIGKSFALRALATFGGVSYFTDAIGDIHQKEAAMTMHGCLIVELAELDALSKAETTYIKSWITRQEDQYRPPYAATVRKAPRQCVLAGTLNPEGGYLKDSTGNRRFWPVWCTSVDLKAIANDREQLWAEAVDAHFNGEAIFLQGDDIRIAKEAQEERYQDDVWADDIDTFIRVQTEVSVREILSEVLDIPKERRSILPEKRVIRHLTVRGWKRVKRPAPGDLTSTGKARDQWVYISPEEQERSGE